MWGPGFSMIFSFVGLFSFISICNHIINSLFMLYIDVDNSSLEYIRSCKKDLFDLTQCNLENAQNCKCCPILKHFLSLSVFGRFFSGIVSFSFNSIKSQGTHLEYLHPKMVKLFVLPIEGGRNIWKLSVL